MQPLIAAMLRVRQAFYDALIKSLLGTKSLQTFLNIWISPSITKGGNVDAEESGNGATLGAFDGVRNRRGAEFIEEVKKAFQNGAARHRLAALSEGLRSQFQDSLHENPLCMLPSYNHQLPTGEESGTYLAVDVGGSTLRVALIELSGRKSEGQRSRILKKSSFKIDSAVKQLKGVLFFDWIAERIDETLAAQAEDHEMPEAPLSMGLAWSFPIV